MDHRVCENSWARAADVDFAADRLGKNQVVSGMGRWVFPRRGDGEPSPISRGAVFLQPQRRRQCTTVVAVMLAALCASGCDNEETNHHSTDDAHTVNTDISSSDAVDSLTNTVDVQTSLPYLGSVAVGEYEQPNLTGVTLYGVFAQTTDLSAPYDETIGVCRLRFVAAGEKIPEPVGLEVGDVVIGGAGAQQTITLDSYDLGDQHGGVAYSLVPEDLPKSIFNDTGNITITVTGQDAYPPLTVDVPVPTSIVDLSPALDDLPTELSQDVSFIWTPGGADAVLIELDATATDGSATQLRCRFEDTGSGTISATALSHFQGMSYFGGVVRLNEQTTESGNAKLTGVLSQRQVVFVF
ncbi:MAG: hypothetical protein HUU55_21315 [Myxococcales bacterium]|nr:hypothetical protein [Myxococcales bacterium]